MTNSVFRSSRGNNETWANACVGNNGITNNLAYAEGYSKASKLLLDYVLTNHGRDIDDLVYPICFNMRHSIELRLKSAVKDLILLEEIKTNNSTIDYNKVKSKHDINIIWNEFKVSSNSIDDRFIRINNLMDLTILDIGKIDATGQTFRYPEDTEEDKHLVGQSVINCVVLKDKFTQLEVDLNNLHRLIKELIEEYRYKSYISICARNQIFNLAKTLPLRHEWGEKLNKAKIKRENGFTSKQLEKVLNIIQSNYETSAIIGRRLELKSLSDDILFQLANLWMISHKYPSKNNYADEHGVIGSGHLFNIAIEHLEHDNSQEAYNLLDTDLAKSHIADLQALYYISKNYYKYSEEYEMLFNQCFEELNCDSSFYENFYHIYSRSNFLEIIVKSLYFLGQDELAEKIVTELDLNRYYSFIPQARDKSLFKKWEYLDYR